MAWEAICLQEKFSTAFMEVCCVCSAAVRQGIMAWIAAALSQVDGELNVISALLLAFY
jgi:hypothetical protein